MYRRLLISGNPMGVRDRWKLREKTCVHEIHNRVKMIWNRGNLCHLLRAHSQDHGLGVKQMMMMMKKMKKKKRKDNEKKKESRSDQQQELKLCWW